MFQHLMIINETHIEDHIDQMNRFIRHTQLVFATGIERGIQDRQILKYQPLVTCRLIFQYSMFINGIKWWNITLDVTDGWYFRIWQSWMPRSMPVAKSNWVCLLTVIWMLPFTNNPMVITFIHYHLNMLIVYIDITMVCQIDENVHSLVLRKIFRPVS